MHISPLFPSQAAVFSQSPLSSSLPSPPHHVSNTSSQWTTANATAAAHLNVQRVWASPFKARYTAPPNTITNTTTTNFRLPPPPATKMVRAQRVDPTKTSLLESFSPQVPIRAYNFTSWKVGGHSWGGYYNGKVFDYLPSKLNLMETTFTFYPPTTATSNKLERSFVPLSQALIAMGWKRGFDTNSSLVFIRNMIPPFSPLLVSNMGVCNCLGGSKIQQLQCRQHYAAKMGCSYESLGIQPAQFAMSIPEDCHAFFKRNADMPSNHVYLMKPSASFHGDGMQFLRSGDSELHTVYGTCSKKNAPVIAMDLIQNPATMMGQYKFDFRTYLMVASLHPILVFHYDEGLVRRSNVRFQPDNLKGEVHIMNSRNMSVMHQHFFNFSAMHHYLQVENGLPKEYPQKFDSEILRYVKFLVEAEMSQYRRLAPGRFHVFALDWVVDRTGHLHFLEGNKFPLAANYPRDVQLTPKIWQDAVLLVLQLQLYPQALRSQGKFMTVANRYKFGKWTLVYNHIESLWETANKQPYNPCHHSSH